MTKDVLVRILGVQNEMMSPSVEDEPIEIIAPATYYFKNGKHYIVYDEIVDGESASVHNKVKIIGEESLEIMKTGAINAHLMFDRKQAHTTCYATPFGQMMVSVNTKRLDIQVADDEIKLRVDYELDVNHEPLANCRIHMNIVSKDNARFKLAQ